MFSVPVQGEYRQRSARISGFARSFLTDAVNGYEVRDNASENEGAPMKTIFDAVTYDEITRRLEALQPGAPRQWGKMTAAQMLEHTARAAEMATGAKRLKQATLGRMIGWIFRKDFVGEKPFGKNGPTGPDFIVTGIDPDFGTTKARLKSVLDDLHALGEKGCDGNVHAFFGPMTGAEWGVTQYKHVDHHLRQFGA